MNANSLDPNQDVKIHPAMGLALDSVHLILIGIVLSYLLFWGTEVSTLWCTICTSLLVITMIRTGGWAALLAIQVGLAVRENRAPSPMFSMENVAYAWTTLAILAYACSFHTLRNGLRNWLHRTVQILGPTTGQEAIGTSSDELVQPARADHLILERQVVERQILERWYNWGQWRLRGAIRLAMLMIVICLLFFQLPISYAVRQLWWNRSVPELRFWPGPDLILCMVAAVVLLAALRARAMSQQQARMLLRTSLVTNHFSDMKRMVTMQMKRDAK